MKVVNLKMMKNYPFDWYLALPGWSHSGIKNNGKDTFAPTAKMQLGTDVHNYLLTGEEYKHENREIVRPLAVALKKYIGDVLMSHLIPELAVTADFIHEGFKLKYKGRIDLGIPGRLTIDIKVSRQPLFKGIQLFGYDNQQCGYALSIGAAVALIIRIDPVTRFIEIVNIPIKQDWWNDQIKQKGEPL